ncbi:hypothetical protein PC119_g16945 [Phytophthora cactorum]|nr:hypothetical protein PC114_g4057 [Phytophthora cactorum]KAG2997847.1 hypothetical protein PC120_g21235 [Phytophthora cactorum]KAG3000648.1 hypothetical protein PC119_g16945 [Phytophthora cactorum]KAG3157570.1 hypothetical protein PC128_g21653 [Phytophthora cactorum]
MPFDPTHWFLDGSVRPVPALIRLFSTRTCLQVLARTLRSPRPTGAPRIRFETELELQARNSVSTPHSRTSLPPFVILWLAATNLRTLRSFRATRLHPLHSLASDRCRASLQLWVQRLLTRIRIQSPAFTTVLMCGTHTTVFACLAHVLFSFRAGSYAIICNHWVTRKLPR